MARAATVVSVGVLLAGAGGLAAGAAPARAATDRAATRATVTTAATGTTVATTPRTVVDTATGLGGRGRLRPGAAATVTVTGRDGVPRSDVAAVTVRLTAIDPAGAGILTSRFGVPTAVPRPLLRYADRTGGTAVVSLPVSAAGQVSLTASAATGLSAVLTGYRTGTSSAVTTRPTAAAAAGVSVPLARAATPATAATAVKADAAAGSPSITGTVTDLTGTALAGVVVSAFDGIPPQGSGLPAPTPARTATTSAAGRYTLTGLLAGPAHQYTLCFTGSSVAGSATGYAAMCTGAQGPLATGQRLILAPEQLTPGDAVTGAVRSAAGAALVGVPVRLSAPGVVGLVTQTVKTGSGGAFTLEGAVDGANEICADGSDHLSAAAPDGYTTACTQPAPIGVGGTISGVTLVLTKGGTVTGTVTTPVANGAAAPLPGVAVSVSDAHVVLTDTQGSYTLTGVPAGAQSVCFRAPGVTAGPSTTGYLDDCGRDGFGDTSGVPVTVAPGATATADDSLAPAAALSGTVTGPDGSPVPGAHVYVGGESVAYQDTYAASEGTYALTGLDPSALDGTVCVDTSALPAPGDISQCQPAPLTSGQTTQADAALTAGGAVAGTITGSAGRPVPDTFVYVTSQAGVQSAVETDASGRYVLAGLAPDDAYSLGYDPTIPGPSGDGYQGGVDPQTVPVTAGAITDVDQTLLTGGAISGTVTDATSGGPIGNVEISVGGTGYADVTTAADGTYTAFGLPTGSYMLCTSAYPGVGPWPLSYLDVCPVQATRHITAGRHTTGADLALKRAGGITGRVTDTHGNGLAGVQVNVENPTTYASSSATTDATGTFTVPQLRSGKYTLCLDTSQAVGRAPTGYVGECLEGKVGPETFVVTAGQAATDAGTQALATGGAIQGTVSDAHTGAGVGGVGIAAGSSFADSAPSGQYELTGLAPGASTAVCFEGAFDDSASAPYGYITTCAPTAHVVAGKVTVLNEALPQAGAVAGTVTDTAGVPLQSVNVSYTDPTGDGVSAQTGPDGSYELDGVDAGSGDQICFDGTYATDGTSTGFGMACVGATVTGGQLTPDVDVVLPPADPSDGAASGR